MDIIKKNKRFYYTSGSPVIDSEIISRLKKIRVPPAWKDVMYASKPSSHIQVHGIDGGGKKQYILSEKWISRSKSKKYNRLRNFIKDLRDFKRKIKLTEISTFSKETLIHLLFNLLIDTHIRVGNEKYAKCHSTYGLTTLRQKHVSFIDGHFVFSFVGKSKIKHSIIVPEEYNSYLKILHNPEHRNRPFFVYKSTTLNSEELNDYLRQHMGEYTCKDFRTYSANIVFIKTLLKKLKSSSKKIEKLVVECIDESAKSLGNSRTICKKSYISDNLVNYCLKLKNNNVTYDSLLEEI
jgi:DNA topoisomerase-1